MPTYRPLTKRERLIKQIAFFFALQSRRAFQQSVVIISVCRDKFASGDARGAAETCLRVLKCATNRVLR